MLRTVHDHDDWNAGARGETPMQRADRAYSEILQEVRVAQTGVQILFAFLLALAFQARFADITGFQAEQKSDELASAFRDFLQHPRQN